MGKRSVGSTGGRYFLSRGENGRIAGEVERDLTTWKPDFFSWPAAGIDSDSIGPIQNFKCNLVI
jgi:hypothetical protein